MVAAGGWAALTNKLKPNHELNYRSHDHCADPPGSLLEMGDRGCAGCHGHLPDDPAAEGIDGLIFFAEPG